MIWPGDPGIEVETAFARLGREFPDAADAIIAIAEAILDNGRLNGSECYRLFRAACGNPTTPATAGEG